MKNSRVCPKCGCGDIIKVDGYAGAYGSGNNIMVGKTIFSAVNVNRYICCGCGFTEEWIDREDIEKVRKSKRVR
ncbi:MAG: hypothetical protein MR966_04430 [Lachnospiraceae bacterium]|nr:hypothetical protein [Lachnospiraceae bacterium]